MSDAEKIAREILQNGCTALCAIVDARSCGCFKQMTEALLAAEARGYAAAREQAVKIAESHTDGNPYPTRQGAIAEAIRAMEPNT